MASEKILIHALGLRPNAVYPTISRTLAARFPDAAILETESQAFKPHRTQYDAAWTFAEDPEGWIIAEADWEHDACDLYPAMGAFIATWDGHDSEFSAH